MFWCQHFPAKLTRRKTVKQRPKIAMIRYSPFLKEKKKSEFLLFTGIISIFSVLTCAGLIQSNFPHDALVEKSVKWCDWLIVWLWKCAQCFGEIWPRASVLQRLKSRSHFHHEDLVVVHASSRLHWPRIAGISSKLKMVVSLHRN